jgi:hypothetical protein
MQIIGSNNEFQINRKPLNNDSSDLLKNQVLYSDTIK